MKKGIIFIFMLLFVCSIYLTADEKKVVHVPVYLSVLPGAPSFTGVNISTSLGAGLIGSVIYEVDGMQASSVFNIVESRVNGIQAAGVFNIAEGGIDGFQGSGVFNITEDSVSGFQGAGVFNIAGSDVSGAQAAGVMNIADGTVNFGQFAGVINIADKGINGIQVAGVVNIAGKNVNGAQIGVVNLAETVNGTQIGIVNISEKMNGIPVGLINISGNMIFDPCVWTDDNGYTWGGFQWGFGHYYTILYGGEKNTDYFENADSLTHGIGLGTRLYGDFLSLDVDVSAKSAVQGDTNAKKTGQFFSFDMSESDVFPSIRFVGAAGLPSGSIIGGVSLDVDAPGYFSCQPFNTGKPINFIIGGQEVNVYPKWMIGIKL